tara:strand:- start:90 stop:488 length:399 start_codon:yes stop_codon:yes gene_type:complete
MKHTHRLLEARNLVASGSLIGPWSFVLASIPKLKEVCNGCGAADSWFDFVPDRIIGSYIGHVCYIHDWQYYEGKTKEEKEEADETFKDNLLAVIKLKSTSVVIIAIKYAAAYTYYFGVKRFGSKAYWKGKKQ